MTLRTLNYGNYVIFLNLLCVMQDLDHQPYLPDLYKGTVELAGFDGVSGTPVMSKSCRCRAKLTGRSPLVSQDPLTTRCPSSTLLPFFSLGVSLLKPNMRNKGTLITKGLLGNLGKEYLQPKRPSCLGFLIMVSLY